MTTFLTITTTTNLKMMTLQDHIIHWCLRYKIPYWSWTFGSNLVSWMQTGGPPYSKRKSSNGCCSTSITHEALLPVDVYKLRVVNWSQAVGNISYSLRDVASFSMFIIIIAFIIRFLELATPVNCSRRIFFLNLFRKHLEGKKWNSRRLL